MGTQMKDWGSIQWMDNGEAGLFQKGLNVGIVTLKTGAHQPPHVHYEEQVFYVIQGQAISLINGEKTSLAQGRFFRWPAGVTHEIFNIGNVPFQHLLISNPSGIELENFLRGNRFPKKLSQEDLEKILIVAVEAVRTQFLETLHHAYRIFDRNGIPLLQSNYQAKFCMDNCQPVKDGLWPCMADQKPWDCKEEHKVICPNGLTLFHVPIYFEDYFLGYIQGGYIYQSRQSGQKLEGVYDTPESSAIGLLNLLRKIAKAIKNYCEFEEFRRELLEQELKLNTSRERQRILLTNLKRAEYEATDLKINNHFLFNTLNGMASMALDCGQMPLYQSIVDLSKMFHYTLQNQDTLVPLKKELEFLKAYLQLQKLRYGENLHVTYRLDQGVGEVLVPFNFLQPIAENAFTHGFADEEQKYLEIAVDGREDRLHIRIGNSGKYLDEKACRAIHTFMKSNTSHGISMVYHKLFSNYGENFVFRVSQENEMTCFFMDIPRLEGRAGDPDDPGSDL